MEARRHSLIDAAADAAQRLSTNGGAAAAPARSAALAQLDRTGLPGLQDESWRFTPLQSLESADWRAAERPASAVQGVDFSIQDFDGVRLVLVDGYLDPALSELTELPAGVTVDLEGVSGDDPESLTRDRSFEALNLAAASEPLLLQIRGLVARPLHFICYSTASAGPKLASPRLRVQVAEGAQVAVIEDQRSAADSTDLVNLHITLDVSANAQVDWTRIVRTGDAHRQVARMRVRQQRDSRVGIQAMTIGGALVRHDIELSLDGTNAECALNGLVIGEGHRIADNHSLIRHAADHARSAEHFRNILDGQSRAVFAGRVVVEAGRKGSETHQNNANLLLSAEARVNALPQLEIHNDDVKASHGSTLGRLDPDAMFYLRSRGIDEAAARQLLTWAFANVVVEEIRIEAIRRLVRRSVFEHLPGSGLDEAVLGGLQ